jgi:hypothetical protein
MQILFTAMVNVFAKILKQKDLKNQNSILSAHAKERSRVSCVKILKQKDLKKQNSILSAHAKKEAEYLV